MIETSAENKAGSASFETEPAGKIHRKISFQSVVLTDAN